MPDYIPTSTYQCTWTPDESEARRLWTTYCTPPTTVFQISSFPSILDTPLSNARQWSTTSGLFLDKGIILACRFYPSTFCVPYIVFHYAYDRTAGARRAIVEIREDDNGKPKGSFLPWPDNNILSRVSVAFPTDLYSLQQLHRA